MMKTFASYQDEDLIRSASHHLEIVRALEARDADWSAALMRSHILGARGAMRVPLGHAEVGAVEAAGVHADQDLRALRGGLGDIGDCSAIGAVDIGLHAIILGWLGCEAVYSAA